MSELDAAEREEILREFLAESRENLDRIEVDLVALEAEPDPKRIASVFRAVHTMKGACGWLGLSRLEALTHAGEDLLSKIRDAEVEITPEVISTVLALVDALRTAVQRIASSRTDEGFQVAALVERIERAAAAPRQSSSSVALGAITDMQAETSIRVDVALLDLLMTQVGELVLARNRLMQSIANTGSNELTAVAQRLNLVAGSLQESVMRTRMQPIRHLWSKLPRLVRDLARELGKEVQLVMEGANTELDRTLIEAIKDPLVHLIRNALDHGIENPGLRADLGKRKAGTLSLRAFHEGGHVNVEISDDGHGIDPEKLKRRAVDLGLLTLPQASALSEREAFQLVFQAGLSTATTVTALSGRGVGMDVVRSNVESIGGSIEIVSVLGQGTTWKIKIPLTLAIIPALIVGVGGQRYAVPQLSLVELVRVDGGGAQIEQVYGTPVFRLRGSLLPLVHLASLFAGRQRGTLEGIAAAAAGECHIVVVEAEGRRFGIVVGAIFDTEEIVVKPLGGVLRQIDAIAGATIMGDGRVALILDVLGIARMANVLAEEEARLPRAPERVAEEMASRQLLLLEGSDGGQLALDLAQIARLEEFPADALERLGQRTVVQYRGAVLPLVHLSSLLQERRRAPRRAQALAGKQTTVNVVVYVSGTRSIGLLVERVVDIVNEAAVLQSANNRRGVVGTCVVRGRATELLDLETLLEEREHAATPAAEE